METKKVYRDESTPDRREIWRFVERAAARSDRPRDPEKTTSEQRQAAPQHQARGSDRE
jgi:hypothetical protein